MKCLCCGKPITNSATNVEKEWCWHKKCVKRFFQTDELPILDITKEQLEILANEIVNEGLTVPGVQKKLSLHFINRSLMQDLQLWTIRQVYPEAANGRI